MDPACGDAFAHRDEPPSLRGSPITTDSGALGAESHGGHGAQAVAQQVPECGWVTWNDRPKRPFPFSVRTASRSHRGLHFALMTRKANV